MPRKPVVKVILSPQQYTLMQEISRRYGLSDSEVLRTALMDYAKEIGALNLREAKPPGSPKL
jgi:hypothetical protein